MTGKLPPHPPEEPWHVHQPFPPHHHHYHDIHHVAPECDDQLAVFSGMGRGLRGDGYRVVIKSDVEAETYLEGLLYDAATNTYSSEWISENINGGQLMYQYNLRPYTNPQTFTITFRYKRPNRSASEWVWTTPAIPYIWDADDDGLADVDGIVGTGVATLFLKKTTDPSWLMVNLPTSHTEAEATTRQEKLLYPDDWTREMFNAPVPGDPWTVNLQYGIGGDIDAPNIEDLAKIIGVNVDFLRDLVEDRDLPGPGDTFGTKENGDPMNTKEYIDKQNEHIHQDMGFGGAGTGSTNFPSDGGSSSSGAWSHPIQVTSGTTGGTTQSTATSVKGYIDEGDQILRDRIKNLEDANGNLKNALQALVNKIVGGGTVNNNGTITWPSGSPLSDSNGKIAAGTLNVYGGDNRGKWIKTHENEANDDVWAR